MDKDIKAIIIAIIVLVCICSPIGVALVNNYGYMMQKADDMTSYKTRKQVEDTCRSLIVSYENDKLMYLQYKDSEKSEQQGWAANAKIRANNAALTYNEYILKNNYVFDGIVPSDIKNELEILQ